MRTVVRLWSFRVIDGIVVNECPGLGETDLQITTPTPTIEGDGRYWGIVGVTVTLTRVVGLTQGRTILGFCTSGPVFLDRTKGGSVVFFNSRFGVYGG